MYLTKNKWDINAFLLENWLLLMLVLLKKYKPLFFQWRQLSELNIFKLDNDKSYRLLIR